jgi:post-segregation antitoxin (ccd killing protein)
MVTLRLKGPCTSLKRSATLLALTVMVGLYAEGSTVFHDTIVVAPDELLLPARDVALNVSDSVGSACSLIADLIRTYLPYASLRRSFVTSGPQHLGDRSRSSSLTHRDAAKPFGFQRAPRLVAGKSVAVCAHTRHLAIVTCFTRMARRVTVDIDDELVTRARRAVHASETPARPTSQMQPPVESRAC